MLQLAQHHCPVLHLVVQLQTLNEVLERAGILGVLHLLVDGVELEIRFNKRTKKTGTIEKWTNLSIESVLF